MNSEASFTDPGHYNWLHYSLLGNEMKCAVEATVVLTINLSPLDKMAAISPTTFSETFSWIKIFVFW